MVRWLFPGDLRKPQGQVKMGVLCSNPARVGVNTLPAAFGMMWIFCYTCFVSPAEKCISVIRSAKNKCMSQHFRLCASKRLTLDIFLRWWKAVVEILNIRSCMVRSASKITPRFLACFYRQGSKQRVNLLPQSIGSPWKNLGFVLI